MSSALVIWCTATRSGHSSPGSRPSLDRAFSLTVALRGSPGRQRTWPHPPRNLRRRQTQRGRPPAVRSASAGVTPAGTHPSLRCRRHRAHTAARDEPQDHRGDGEDRADLIGCQAETERHHQREHGLVAPGWAVCGRGRGRGRRGGAGATRRLTAPRGPRWAPMGHRQLVPGRRFLTFLAKPGRVHTVARRGLRERASP